MPGVLCIERAARGAGPVQAGRLLGSMVAEADSDEFGAVCGAEVERVGRVCCGECGVLELQDLDDRLAEGSEHFVQWVGAVPAGLVAVMR